MTQVLPQKEYTPSVRTHVTRVRLLSLTSTLTVIRRRASLKIKSRVRARARFEDLHRRDSCTVVDTSCCAEGYNRPGSRARITFDGSATIPTNRFRKRARPFAAAATRYAHSYLLYATFLSRAFSFHPRLAK